MNKNIQPTISISLKKPLIRIYKETLFLIGKPDHILLLVNPQENTIVITPSNKADIRAHYVAKYFAKNKKSVELYSTSLIKQLRTLCPIWQDNQAYKIFGEHIQCTNIVKFNMSDALLITKRGL